MMEANTGGIESDRLHMNPIACVSRLPRTFNPKVIYLNTGFVMDSGEVSNINNG
jgi:hypothetical protein